METHTCIYAYVHTQINTHRDMHTDNRWQSIYNFLNGQKHMVLVISKAVSYLTTCLTYQYLVNACSMIEKLDAQFSPISTCLLRPIHHVLLRLSPLSPHVLQPSYFVLFYCFLLALPLVLFLLGPNATFPATEKLISHAWERKVHGILALKHIKQIPCLKVLTK